MILAHDPDEMAPSQRRAAIAELLATGYLRALARQRGDSAPEGLAEEGQVEAQCRYPVTHRPATPEARP